MDEMHQFEVDGVWNVKKLKDVFKSYAAFVEHNTGKLDTAAISGWMKAMGEASPLRNSKIFNMLRLLNKLIPLSVKKQGYSCMLSVVCKQFCSPEVAEAIKDAHTACWDAYMTIQSWYAVLMCLASILKMLDDLPKHLLQPPKLNDIIVVDEGGN